jgi:hypothetical protein
MTWMAFQDLLTALRIFQKLLPKHLSMTSLVSLLNFTLIPAEMGVVKYALLVKFMLKVMNALITAKIAAIQNQFFPQNLKVAQNVMFSMNQFVLPYVPAPQNVQAPRLFLHVLLGCQVLFR